MLDSLFERAVSVAGRDYLAHKLWDKYLEFENAQEEFATVSSLYRRILTTPLKQLDTYWSQFTTFAASRPVADLVVSAKEKTRLEEAANNHPDAASGRDVEAIMREILISWREETYKETSKKLQEFSHFEQAIKRYYFHVQPLATAQQDNWRSYLEHAIKEGDHDRTVRLFERCLEACALYFEFWQRYVRYLESKGDVEGALGALRRAAKVFLKRRYVGLNVAMMLLALQFAWFLHSLPMTFTGRMIDPSRTLLWQSLKSSKTTLMLHRQHLMS